MRLRSLAVLAAAVLAAPAAHAGGFMLFQHGGRATAQAGAFTGRAIDPSAIYYNPAAIARLSGLQIQAGLDFSIADDTFTLADETFAAKHDINFPPAAYLSWKPGDSAVSFGLGIDSPMWHTEDWLPALFPRAAETRRFEVRLLQVHPVVAWRIGERWSFGAGAAYVSGQLQEGNRQPVIAGGQESFLVQIERNTKADGDGWAWDVGLHYAEPSWGWGATLRSGVELSGGGKTTTRADGFVPPGREPAVDAAAATVAASTSSLSFELPLEVAGGVWWAPYPELRLEVDLALQAWSQTDNLQRAAGVCGAITCVPTLVDRDWNDTVSIRLGAEGNITDNFRLGGGLAWEPSPVPSSRLEPGFPRGDAYVYAIGAGYDYPWLSFDLGYSVHEHQNVTERRPNGGRYSASEQVFAVGARWRF